MRRSGREMEENGRHARKRASCFRDHSYEIFYIRQIIHIENRRYRTFVPDVKQALNFEILYEEQTKN